MREAASIVKGGWQTYTGSTICRMKPRAVQETNPLPRARVTRAVKKHEPHNYLTPASAAESSSPPAIQGVTPILYNLSECPSTNAKRSYAIT